jgi:hypothetical protein
MVPFPTLRLRRLGREDVGPPVDAMIVILYSADQRAEVEELARHWAPAVPRGAFAGLELDLTARRVDLASLRALIDEAADELGLEGRQVVLIGAGRAGRLAIDLSMLGVAPGAAVIALDIPLDAVPTSLAPTPSSVRMIQQSTPDDPGGERFHAVVGALQGRGVNVRSMLLPELGAVAQRAARRAAGAYLVELVANAGRLAPTARSWP